MVDVCSMATPEQRAISAGVNGPGVIGRHFIQTVVDGTYRSSHESGHTLRICAVNDHDHRLASLVRLLRSDSIYGPWRGHTVEGSGNALRIDRKAISYFVVDDPSQIPWETVPIDIVIESARVFNNPADAERHLRNPSPTTVIVASSPKKKECPVIIFGVNHHLLRAGRDQVISAATCSSNALFPVAAVLNREFRLTDLFALTVHAATGENTIYDRLDDDPGKRGVLNNILPEQTGAAKTFFQVFPDLREQLEGHIRIQAVRAPVDTGSVFFVSANVSKATSVAEVRSLFRSAEREGIEGTLLPGIIRVSTDPLTVADVRGFPDTGVVDESSIVVRGGGKTIELSIFYDNIAGFTAQMARLAQYIGRQL